MRVLMRNSLILSLLLFHACSSSNESRRGKLSDAMEKASEENRGDRKVPTYRPPEPDVVVETMPLPPDTAVQREQEGDEEFISHAKRENRKSAWVGLRFGGGTLIAADFNGLAELGVSLGTYFDDQIYGELWGYIGGSSLTGSSPLNKSITESVTFAGLGAEGKFFLTPSHTFLGPYVLTGVTFSKMPWAYVNSIQANTYD